MGAIAKSGTKRLLLAACTALAPASLLAAVEHCPGDPFAAYNNVAQPEGGQPYYCTPETPRAAGAAGPAGPTMTPANLLCREEMLHPVDRVFRGEGHDYTCASMMEEHDSGYRDWSGSGHMSR